MTDEELAEIVENLRTFGTDVADVEVKKAHGGFPKSVRETLSSFSNTKGGAIILGLDEGDNFAATGLTDPGKMAADLGSCCAEMEPPLRPHIMLHTFEGVEVLVAEIPELDISAKPCYYKGAGITKGSYIRVNDGDHQLTSYEVQIMLSGRGQPREDEQPVEGTSIDDLDPRAIAEFVSRLKANRPYAFPDELSVEDCLRRAKVLVPRKDSADAASIAGLLSLGKYPQQYLPQVMLTFVHYPTKSGGEPTTGERFLDNVAVEGPIPVMVRDTMAALRRNMARRSVVSGMGRADTWEYPETALREAVVNALVHRDLSAQARGTQVQIEMYPDRLLVKNPGGLFGPVSINDLGEEGVSSSRNATLLKILEDVAVPNDTRTVCENRGSGIRSMIDALREARMSLPRFDDKISTFTVTFPNHTLMSDEIVGWISSLGEDGLTDSQCLALATMREGEQLDNLSYRTLAGIDSRQATTELQDLVARELVDQDGTRRWTRYRIAERVNTAPGERVPARRRSADRRDQILATLGANTLSRSEIARITGLSDQIVGRWLRVLRSEGRVEITDSNKPNSKLTRYKRTDPPQVLDGDQAALFDDPGEL